MRPSYNDVVSHYPTFEREELFRSVLGGGFVDLIDNKEAYGNTCAIRLSVVLNRLGGDFKVTSDFAGQDGNHKDGLGNFVIVKVKVMLDLLIAKLGTSDFAISKDPGKALDFKNTLPGRGVVSYVARPQDFEYATGHIDIWTGESCLWNCPAEDVGVAYAVQFWKLD